MKKKSTPQSAFFNLRVLIGLCIILVGAFLALAGFGAFSALAQGSAKAPGKNIIITNSTNPLVPNGFDCSKIHQLGIDKQDNFRAQAIMIACGQAQGGSPSLQGSLTQILKQILAPLTYGGTDVDLITGPESPPNITQSETYSLANPDDPNQVLVAYVDSRGATASPFSISGASYSSDGGATFTRLTRTSGQGPFSGTLGDPVALYNKPTGTWFTVWIDTGCGAQGLGGYKSTTPGDPSPASWTHFCIHSNSADDRPSGWSDNNPASPFYGQMYVSWNDFNVPCGPLGACIFVARSTDNGLTWSSPVQVNSGGTFIRNLPITGNRTDGTLFIEGLDEGGGGFPHNDTNKIYKSTDGAVTWTNTYTGALYPGPGRGVSGYFACMYSSPPYWRYEGGGQVAALNGNVHLVYSAGLPAGDPGNVFYIRSTNGGFTFSDPVQLNATADHTKAQWEPSLSITSSGTLLATWYDEAPRVAGSCQPSSPARPCYRMHANVSNDGGVTWLGDMGLSDVASPLPLQPDPSIVDVYAGDYDYGSAISLIHFTSWVDGRVIIGGASQQDAFTDRELLSGCPPQDHYSIAQIGGSIVPGTIDTGNHCDDCDTVVNLPFPYTLYDNIYTSVNVSSNGRLDFACNNEPHGFGNTCLPTAPNLCPFDYTIFPYWDDQRTDALSDCASLPGGQCGIFTSVTGIAPNRIFNIEWRTVYFNNIGPTANYEVRLYEGQTRFDVIYGTLGQGNTSATAGVQKNDTTFDQYFCDGSGGAATGGQSYIVQTCYEPTITSAVSRKTHGGAGMFDINLPLMPPPNNGVECRTDNPAAGTTSDYTIVVTFAGNVTVTGSPQAELTMGTGCVGTGGVCTGTVTVSSNVVTIPLTNVTNVQNINVRINGVNSAASDAPADNFNIPMGVLWGDTNGNRTVNAGDVSQTRAQTGAPVTGANFRNDVNHNGSINAGDVSICKTYSGTGL